jgi:hypothetical protein
MSRRSKAATANISLFPFLAVLICAMGALILLLLVITRNIRQDAIHRWQTEKSVAVTQPPAQPRQPLIDPNTLLQQRIERLSAVRSQRADEVRSHYAMWADAQQRNETSQASLSAAESELATIAAERSRFEASQAANAPKLDSLQQQIDSLEAKRQRMQGTVNEGSRYTFVPFDGVSGTTRRPILIECTDKGLRFLPEDILLTADELRGSSVTRNPALAGANALKEYWKRQGERRNEPPAYVLLVVRPSGSVSYHVARKLLTSLDEPFGYELVEEDWQLDLPEADRHARDACRKAIETTLAAQKTFMRPSPHDSLPEVALMERAAAGPVTDEAEDVRAKSFKGFAAPRRVGTPRRLDALHGGALEPAPARPGREVAGGPPIEPLVPSDGDGGLQEIPHAGTQPDPGPPSRPAEASANEGRIVTGEMSSPQPQQPDSVAALNPFAPLLDDEDAPAVDGSGQPGAASPAVQPEIKAEPMPPGPIPSSMIRSSNPEAGKRKWGIHSRRATIGFKRQIQIDLYAQEIRVAGGASIVVDQNKTYDQLSNELVAGLESEVLAWGRPPENFYWVPDVKFAVHKDGFQHYERAKAAFEAVDVATTVEHVLESSEESATEPQP